MPASQVPITHCPNCLANSEGVYSICPACGSRTVNFMWAWRCDTCGRLDDNEERAIDCCEEAEETPDV